jgi:hypothetical protein
LRDNNHQDKVLALISKELNGVQNELLTKEVQELVNTAALCAQELCFYSEQEKLYELRCRRCSGIDRRQFSYSNYLPERRSVRDRR